MNLRTIIRKGRFIDNWPDNENGRGNFDHVARMAMTTLRDPATILVNAQSVMDDMRPALNSGNKNDWLKVLDYSAIPRAVPPFGTMWLECESRMDGLSTPRRIGALVGRFETHGDAGSLFDGALAKHSVVLNAPDGFQTLEDVRAKLVADQPPMFIYVSTFRDLRESALYGGGFCYWVDEQGQFLSCVRQFPRSDDPRDGKKYNDIQITMLRTLQAWVMQTFARLNCNNVELRQMNEGKHRPHHHRKLVPATVWHEIVVTSTPKLRSGGRDVFEKEEHDIRAHWIRGHYADYRRGPGLFGNPKLRCLYWIPEHRSGNEELGQVIPEYTIQ